MAKLVFVRLQNFQCYEDETFDLSDINFIVGRSNIGKSAIVRGIRTVVENRFSENFRRTGAERVTVTLTLDDDHVVIFARSKKTTYRIKFPDGTVKEYTNVGRNVPEDVKKVLNMHRMDFGSGVSLSLNMQLQGDANFITMESNEAKIAKVLGAISVTSILMSAVSKATRGSLSNKGEISSINGLIGEYTDKVESLSDVDAIVRKKVFIDKKMLALSSLQDNAKAVSDLVEDFQEAVTAIDIINMDMSKTVRLLELEEDIKEADKKVKEHKEIYLAYDEYQTLCEDLDVLEPEIKFMDFMSQNQSMIEVIDLVLKLHTIDSELGVVTDSYKRSEAAISILSDVVVAGNEVQRHNILESELTKTSQEVAASSKTLERCNQEMAEFIMSSGSCPLIQETFKEGCKELILKVNS